MIDEAPDLAAIIPDEYCEEQKEGLSLDSILRGDEDETDTFDEVEEHDLEVEDEEAR